MPSPNAVSSLSLLPALAHFRLRRLQLKGVTKISISSVFSFSAVLPVLCHPVWHVALLDSEQEREDT